MKILVPIKRVVDANIKVKVSENGSLDTESLKKSLNPFDEIAVEEAVQLKEKGVAQEVVAVSIGEAKCADTLRVALAMGADRAVLIEADKSMSDEPLNVAKLLVAFIKKENPELIICGKQAVDNDANQVGQMIAALCDYPQATHVSKLEIQGEKATVAREVDGGFELLELSLPAVVTADLRLNAPRYVTLPMMMKAKKKTMETVSAETLGVQCRPHTEVLKYEAPKARNTGVILYSVDELIDRLKNEAKVL